MFNKFLSILLVSSMLLSKADIGSSSSLVINYAAGLQAVAKQDKKSSNVQFPKTRAKLLKKSEAKIQAAVDEFKQKTGIDILKLAKEGADFKNEMNSLEDAALRNTETSYFPEEGNFLRRNLIRSCIENEGLDADDVSLICDPSQDQLAAGSVLKSKKFIFSGEELWSYKSNIVKAVIHHEISHLRHNDSEILIILKAFENSKYFKSEYSGFLERLKKEVSSEKEYRADMEAATYSLDNAKNFIEFLISTFLRNMKTIISVLALPAGNEFVKIYYQALSAVKPSEEYLKDYDKEGFCKLAKAIKRDFNQCYDKTHPSDYKRIEAIRAIMLECEQEAKEIA
jgi:hypothetical protein